MLWAEPADIPIVHCSQNHSWTSRGCWGWDADQRGSRWASTPSPESGLEWHPPFITRLWLEWQLCETELHKCREGQRGIRSCSADKARGLERDFFLGLPIAQDTVYYRSFWASKPILPSLLHMTVSRLFLGELAPWCSHWTEKENVPFFFPKQKDAESVLKGLCLISSRQRTGVLPSKCQGALDELWTPIVHSLVQGMLQKFWKQHHIANKHSALGERCYVLRVRAACTSPFVLQGMDPH